MPAPDELHDSPPSSDRYDPKLDLQVKSVLNLLNIAQSDANPPSQKDVDEGQTESDSNKPVAPKDDLIDKDFQDFDKSVLDLFGNSKSDGKTVKRMDTSNPVEIPLPDAPKNSKAMGSFDFSSFTESNIQSMLESGRAVKEDKAIQLVDKEVLDLVDGTVHKVGSDGLVSIDNNVVTNPDSYVGTRKVELDDGTYIRDEKGRVISTEDKSGRVKRSFDFSGSNNPTKPSSVTVGDTTYVRIGAITSGGKPVQQDGFDMHSWSIKDSAGRLKGNWYGDMRISENGIFSVYENKSKELEQKGAGDTVLTKQAVERQESDGIWPSDISVVRPNDTRISAQLKGNVIESMKESYSQDGKEVVRNWSHQDGKWVSDQRPPEIRTKMSLNHSGRLTYENQSGQTVSEYSDGSKSIAKDSKTNWYDRYGRQTSSIFEGGSREFKYEVDQNDFSKLSEVTTTIGKEQSNWVRQGGGKTWKNRQTNETVSDLKVAETGDLVFENRDGKKVRLDTNLARTTYDSKDRPTEIEFTSGAKRALQYDSKGLASFEDIIPHEGKLTKLDWSRVGDSSKFESYRDGGKRYERQNVSVTESGDIDYIGQDGKRHSSRARDIDRIARGEFVLSSESLVESRDRLVELAHETGLDTERFNSWVNEFEANARENKVDPEKVVKSMNNISDLLSEPSDGGQYTARQRVEMAEILMHNLARPLEIDQGSHPTCNVTSVEVYSAVKEPDAYTGLVRDAALTGRWKTRAGKTATPPMAALKPGIDERQYDVGKPDSGKRSLASQVFQMTLINAMYETGEMNKKGRDNTSVRYILEEKLPITRWENGYKVTITPGEDELTRNGKKMPGNRDSDGPQMVQSDVLRSCEILFGDRPAYIENTSYYSAPGRGRVYDHDLVSKEQLFEYKKNNQFPILTPTMGGMHAQTIHDVWSNPQDGSTWVLLDNQHGEPEAKGKNRRSGEGDGDGWIKLDTLHRTLRMSSEGRGYGQPVMPKIRKYDHPSRHR